MKLTEWETIEALDRCVVNNRDFYKKEIIYPILKKIDEQIEKHTKEVSNTLAILEILSNKKAIYKEIKHDLFEGYITDKDEFYYELSQLVDDSNNELYKDMIKVYHAKVSSAHHALEYEAVTISKYTTVKNKIHEHIRWVR